MDDRVLMSGERVLLTTPDVVVKSVPYEAVLTNRRVILTDMKNDANPKRELPLESVRRAEAGENAIRDPTLTLSIASGNETRQMIMTFPQRTGATRKRERDEWMGRFSELAASSGARSARDVIAAPGSEQRKRIIEYTAQPENELVQPSDQERGRDSAPGESGYGKRGSLREPAPEEEPTESLFCSRCGNRLPPGSLFCSRCGTKTALPRQGPVPGQPGRENFDLPDRNRAAGTAGRPENFREPEYSTGRIGPHHREGHGLLSWLFPKKKPRQHRQSAHPASPSPPPARRLPSGSTARILKTVAIIAVIIVVIAVVGYTAMNFISTLGSKNAGSSGTDGGSAAAPTTASTLAYSAISTVTVVHTTAPVTIPAQGISLHVSYLGAWSGTYTVNGETQTLKRSGEYVTTLEDAAGTVSATFKKLDASAHELDVEFYKDGVLLKSGLTKDPNGAVTVSADTGIVATATPTPTPTKTPTVKTTT